MGIKELVYKNGVPVLFSPANRITRGAKCKRKNNWNKHLRKRTRYGLIQVYAHYVGSSDIEKEGCQIASALKMETEHCFEMLASTN
jgi:hypothetical protein